MEDTQYLEAILSGIIEHPERVRVSRSVDELGVLLTLELHPDDMGKVIGRSGNTASAIRVLLKAFGARHNARINMKILEPEGGKRMPSKTEDIDAAITDLKL